MHVPAPKLEGRKKRAQIPRVLTGSDKATQAELALTRSHFLHMRQVAGLDVLLLLLPQAEADDEDNGNDQDATAWLGLGLGLGVGVGFGRRQTASVIKNDATHRVKRVVRGLGRAFLYLSI